MKKSLIRVLAVLMAVLSLFSSCSRRRMQAAGDAQEGLTAEEILALKNPAQPDLIVDGTAYVRKRNLTTVLFMGIDQKGDLDAASGGSGGQCDVLLLLVVDGDAKKQTLLQLDRDTMTEVEVLDYNGNPTGFTLVQQICLSHSYGNGGEKSCENTVRAVSRFLLDTPVDGYVAMLYDAVPVLNDAVGGVTVTIRDDFSTSDPAFVKGSVVTLQGQQALTYVRGRMKVADGTNGNRMARQREYMSAFSGKVRNMVKTDSSVINDLYYAAEPYMLSSMTLGELTSVAAEGLAYTDGGIVTTAGEHREAVYANGKTYAEFYAEEDNILEIVLSLFYTQIS